MVDKIVILGNYQEWLDYCLLDLKKIDNAKLINTPYLIPVKSYLKFLAKLSFSKRLGILNYPLQCLWFPYFCKKISNNKNISILLIMYDHNFLAYNIPFLMYLKKHFKKIRLVYVFTNIIKGSGANKYNFTEKLKDYYDLVYAFDENDAKKYKFNYNPLIYSKINNYESICKQKVFYVGRSKDRYDMLISVYEKLKELNISSKFYITHVDKDIQKYPNEIVYNKRIPYKEALKNIFESNCLLDVIQGNSSGLTIKVCEAITYNKMLITTNQNIKNSPFFDERYIKVIKNANDITADFFKNEEPIQYNSTAQTFFSLETFLKKVLSDLQVKST